MCVFHSEKDFDGIKSKIDNILAGEKNPFWYIGVTDRPEERKIEHGNPGIWNYWKPSDGSISREIEEHFFKFDVDGGPDGPGNATYLYLYKKPV